MSSKLEGIALDIKEVDKFYKTKKNLVHAVKKISLQIKKEEIVAFLGPSGCGKTSLLMMIAGFEEVSRGKIEIGGMRVDHLPPSKRNVSMAFEGYSLYPPMTIGDNIAFALKSSSFSKTEIHEKVKAIADLLEISDILKKYPNAISGGQQQRVSLGRSLIRDAMIHLLDEPIGQLEPQLRAILRGRIKHYIKKNHLTAILVTHNQVDANALADRVAVISSGVLQQFSFPDKIKYQPTNTFTGSFMGEPPMNSFRVECNLSDDQVYFSFDQATVMGYEKKIFPPQILSQLKSQPKGEVVLGIRPYAIQEEPTGHPVKIASYQWLGDQTHLVARLAGQNLILVKHDRSSIKVGEIIRLKFPIHHIYLFEVETGKAFFYGSSL